MADKPTWVNNTEIIIGVVLAIIAAVTGYQTYLLNRSVAAFDQELKSREQARQDMADVTSLRFRVYDVVTGFG